LVVIKGILFIPRPTVIRPYPLASVPQTTHPKCSAFGAKELEFAPLFPTDAPGERKQRRSAKLRYLSSHNALVINDEAEAAVWLGAVLFEPLRVAFELMVGDVSVGDVRVLLVKVCVAVVPTTSLGPNVVQLVPL
jgi:hypothetical protein